LLYDLIKVLNYTIMAKGGGGGFSGLPIGFGFGSFVMCKDSDTSWFCTLSKVVSTIGMILFLLTVVYFIYFFFFKKKGRK
jgi:hypothetical protein